VVVSTPNQGACEGFFVPSPWEFMKGNSGGLFVACGSLSYVSCAAPGCGLDV
jgi:hypothetical protein